MKVFLYYYTEAYSEPSHASKMDLFAKVFAKGSILDVCLRFEYASAVCITLAQTNGGIFK